MAQSKMRHPARLASHAIVEAACEIRFKSQMPGASSLLLGILYQNIPGAEKRIEPLPLSNIPSPVVEANPALQFTPTHRLAIDHQFVVVGDRILGVAIEKYAGWDNFKSHVLLVWKTLSEHAPFIESIDRFSIKYINVLPEVTEDNYSKLTNVLIEMSSQREQMWPFQVRAEFKRESYVDVVQVVSEATAKLPDREIKGFLIDIDVICQSPDEKLLSQGERFLDVAHERAKDRFFGLLSKEAISARGPEYD